MSTPATILTACAVLGLAACGDRTADNAAPPGSPSNPLVALPDPSATRTPPTEGFPGQGSVPRRRGTRPAPAAAPRGPSASRPCSLVTKTEASAILGRKLAQPLEAPQGPTCIYQTLRSTKAYVTLAVQTAELDALKRYLRDMRRVRVASRTAYCGRYGRPLLYLSLGHDRVLTISGRCAVAARFAARAVARLAARG